MQPTCLYHAPGGGLGHVVRAMALARQLHRLIGGRHLILINTPLAAALAPEPGITLDAVHPDATASEIATILGAHIEALRPILFVADTFPRGIGGELVGLLEGWSACPRVLIARGLPGAYVERYHLRTFIRRHFDLVIVPGDPTPWCDTDQGLLVPPFLIRDVDELLVPEIACQQLRAHRPVVLLAGSGTIAECAGWIAMMRALAQGWPADGPPLRLALPEGISAPAEVASAIVRPFPLMACLRGVRVLVGNAGYNLVHEARATQTPALFIARPRLYDDQAMRAARMDGPPGPWYPSAQELREAIQCKLAEPVPQCLPVVNGARTAAGQIVALLGSLRPAGP